MTGRPRFGLRPGDGSAMDVSASTAGTSTDNGLALSKIPTYEIMELKKKKTSMSYNDIAAVDLPKKMVRSISFTKRAKRKAEAEAAAAATAAQQQQQAAYAAASGYPPGMMHHNNMAPVNPTAGVNGALPPPPMMYMGPPQWMPNMPNMPAMPGAFYTCGPDGRMTQCHTGGTGKDTSTNGSYGCYNDETITLNETYESEGSFDSMVCHKTGMGMGRFIGNTVNAFVLGLTGVLDYGANFCQNPNQCQVVCGPTNAAPGEGPVVPVGTTNNVFGDNMNKVLSTNAVAGSENEVFLNDKMDELLKLLKDKESNKSSNGSNSNGSQSSAEIAAIVSKLQAEVNDLNIEKAANAGKPATSDAGMTDIGAQAAQLIEMMRTMNPIININPIRELNALNESAISRASELFGMTNDLGMTHDFKFDPTVNSMLGDSVDVSNNVGNTKANNDRTTSFLTEEVVAEKREEKKKSDQDELSFEFNSKGLSISGTVEPSVVFEHTVVLAPEPEKKVSGHVKKASSGKPPLPVIKALDKDKENAGVAENDMVSKKSRRGLRMKKIVKNLKNKSKESNSPKKTSKKKNPMKKKKKNASSVNISVESPMKNEKKKKIIDQLEQQQQQQAFVADFSPKGDVDSMGFPLNATPKQGNNDNSREWEASFNGSDNLFAGASQDKQGCCTPVVNETRICAWCKKGGTSNPDIVKKLKLCSRCQVTYYCSAECQSQDWVGGHATTCKEVNESVPMY